MNKISFFDAIAQHIELSQYDLILEYQAWYKLLHNCKPEKITELLKDERFCMLGKLRYYFEIVLQEKKKNIPAFYWQEFLQFLQYPIEVFVTLDDLKIRNSQFIRVYAKKPIFQVDETKNIIGDMILSYKNLSGNHDLLLNTDIIKGRTYV